MYSVIKFNLARESISYLINYFKISEMYIPYYLCDVVRHQLVKSNCKPIFYHIDNNFFPMSDFDKKSWILYPNYFGICDNNVVKLANKYPNLIIDNAHSYYSKPQGIACFNSAYKFGIENASYLFIKGKKGKLQKEKYPIANDEKEIRKNKFLNLYKQYSETNLLKIDPNSIPFCYPYLTVNEKEANAFVKELNSKKIIIYRYWNMLPKSYPEYKFYSRLVCIPINIEV